MKTREQRTKKKPPRQQRLFHYLIILIGRPFDPSTGSGTSGTLALEIKVSLALLDALDAALQLV